MRDLIILNEFLTITKIPAAIEVGRIGVVDNSTEYFTKLASVQFRWLPVSQNESALK